MGIRDLFKSPAPPPTADEVAAAILRLTQRKVAEIVPTWRDNKPVEPETNFVQLVKNGWRRNELIFACSSKKSSTASQVRLKVVNKRDQKDLPDHDLRMLLKNPNPRMSEFDFLASIFIFQDFAGIAYYEKVRAKSGKVIQLWPMRPDWTRPMASSKMYIAGYEYGPPGEKSSLLRYEDVLCFPLWDPLNMYSGYPPVAVAARTGDLDNSVTDYIRLMFQEGGIPPGLLKTKQAIDDAIAERMRDRWKERYGGYGNWLEPAVLGYDLEYQQIGLGLEALGLEILDKRSEIRVHMVMKVPPTVTGSLVGLERATLNNAESFERSWWVDDLIPMYKNLSDNFQNQLVPEFGDDIEAVWDFSEVPALMNMYKDKHTAALDSFKAGAITRNQYFESVGLPDIGPRGDVFVMSASMIEVPLKTAKPATTEPKSLKSLEDTVPANAPDNEERLAHEKKVTKALERFLGGELKRIKAGVAEYVNDRTAKSDPIEVNTQVQDVDIPR